jgi:hypothetical protein
MKYDGDKSTGGHNLKLKPSILQNEESRLIIKKKSDK